jgi:hypothetical protein
LLRPARAYLKAIWARLTNRPGYRNRTTEIPAVAAKGITQHKGASWIPGDVSPVGWGTKNPRNTIGKKYNAFRKELTRSTLANRT